MGRPLLSTKRKAKLNFKEWRLMVLIFVSCGKCLTFHFLVDQGDVHFALLTVRETFEFALQNSSPDIDLLSNPEISKLHAEKVDMVIEMLGLKECENTIVGNDLNRGVSGGQKKRVTLGMC
jgi:ABC-type multidrug transport system ATPase subunit